MQTIELEQRYTSGCYSKRDVAIVRAQGARIWDEDGKAYIDCVAGHGVAIVGHCNPAVVAAITEQAQRCITCPEIFYNDVRARFMEKLVAVAPEGLQRVMLVNSGTEAVEGALKLARLSTGRSGLVAAQRGFHGRTMGALSTTWEAQYREPFAPLIPDVTHVPYGKLEAMAQAIGDSTAAVILEVVQGEGGVNIGDGDYLRAVRTLCHERGALLIVDEVQTGFGRTGRMFACEHHGLLPDLMAVAKGIAGGVPMGAVLLGERVQHITPGVHGTTFGGNPLACAAGIAAIDYMLEHDLPGESRRKGAWLLERLRTLDSRLVRDVRGLGLMIGIELRTRVTPYLKALMQQGVMALPAGRTVIRLLPPLVISDEELEMVAGAVERVLTAEAVHA
ncbi:MAG: aspartate aminotransferase family protein [Anaerolineae bacterium]|jgi:acetylornithine/LysW-gamma-L-lysine aminotransferase|nr:aspartate aminotransferase family protein [Chloroflexota bacterium]